MPNILTIFRIACAAFLPLAGPLSPAFFALYALCGVSDMLDGYIARKYQCASPLGAALDSIADFVFLAAALLSLIPALPWAGWMLWWAGAIALMRFASLSVGWLKFRTPAFLHTHANKAAGTGALPPALYDPADGADRTCRDRLYRRQPFSFGGACDPPQKRIARSERAGPVLKVQTKMNPAALIRTGFFDCLMITRAPGTP